MVAVTEQAKEALLQLRTSAKIDGADVGLRLVPGTTGELGLVPDRAKPGDLIVEHDGCTVLLVSQEMSRALSGAKIDCEVTDEGFQLVLRKAGHNNGGPS